MKDARLAELRRASTSARGQQLRPEGPLAASGPPQRADISEPAQTSHSGQLLTHAPQQKGICSIHLVDTPEHGSFGQPRFPEALNPQLRV